MTRRKWVHNFFFYAFVSIGVVLFAIMVLSDLRASERYDAPPPPELVQDQNQESK